MNIQPEWRLIGKVNKETIKYENIDYNIRNTVKMLNSIPWLATLASCEGHVKKLGLVKDKQWIAEGAILLEVYSNEGLWIQLIKRLLSYKEEYCETLIHVNKLIQWNGNLQCLYSKWEIVWRVSAERRLVMIKLIDFWKKLERIVDQYIEDYVEREE